jgi:hypothetical protein
MNDHRTDCQYDTYGQASHRNIYRRILNDFTYKDYDVIATACSQALGRPYHLIESADILYYHEGHYMTPHHDWPYDPRKLDYYQKGGTRDAVALIYLNDNFQGGETCFPHLDISIKPKKGQLGYVDKSFITLGEEGFNVAKVRIREERLPAIGDKMASRAGQKGTLGLIIPEEDMPFNAEGIRPDLIINPHA